MILIAESAQLQIEKLLTRGQYFRIAVSAGGCNGFSHEFSLDSVVREDDVLIQDRVLVDSASLSVIGSAELSYESTIAEKKFVLGIPSAHSFCGCGKSFSI